MSNGYNRQSGQQGIKGLTQPLVEEWISFMDGKFNVRDLWAEHDIQSPEGRQHLRVILSRLVKSGLIADVRRDGYYRRVDSDLTEMEWQKADPENIVPILFPFGIEEHCRIYPKSIIIVAGSKNVGKTALLYQLIQMNMCWIETDLFNSETGPEQMLERFAPLEIPNPAPFKVYERYDNFADVVHPDHLSVIDYLDMDSEVYLVGAEINAIFRKLNKGVAVIALHKPPPTVTYIRGEKKVYDRDLAYGGGFSAKRAVLYITMGSNKLKLLYVKTPKHPKVNPNNMTWTFKISNEGLLTDIQRCYGDE